MINVQQRKLKQGTVWQRTFCFTCAIYSPGGWSLRLDRCAIVYMMVCLLLFYLVSPDYLKRRVELWRSCIHHCISSTDRDDRGNSEQNHDYHIKYNSIVYILLKVSLFDAMSFIKLTIEIFYSMWSS